MGKKKKTDTERSVGQYARKEDYKKSGIVTSTMQPFPVFIKCKLTMMVSYSLFGKIMEMMKIK